MIASAGMLPKKGISVCPNLGYNIGTKKLNRMDGVAHFGSRAQTTAFVYKGLREQAN